MQKRSIRNGKSFTKSRSRYLIILFQKFTSWRSEFFRETISVKDPLFQNSVRSLAFGSSWWPGVIVIVQRRINKKEIRSLFREAISIPNIEFGAIKIKDFILVRRPNESLTCFALSRSIMNPFLSCFCSPPVKYVVSSNASIFLIKIFWVFVSNFRTKCFHIQERKIPEWKILAILYNS